MKRTVAIILLLATAFGFCAFGGAAPSADAASDVLTDSNGAEVVKIKITKDNFLDYFEYKGKYRIAKVSDKESPGKIASFMLWPAYVLKDGYRVAYEGDFESKIEVGVKYKVKFYYPVKKNVKIDFDKLTYKVTGKAYMSTNKDEKLEGSHKLKDDKTWDYVIEFEDATYMSYDVKIAFAVPKKDVKLVSAKGTLYLYKDSIPDSDS